MFCCRWEEVNLTCTHLSTLYKYNIYIYIYVYHDSLETIILPQKIKHNNIVGLLHGMKFTKTLICIANQIVILHDLLVVLISTKDTLIKICNA